CSHCFGMMPFPLPSRSLPFFSIVTATSLLYTLSLHDALPISPPAGRRPRRTRGGRRSGRRGTTRSAPTEQSRGSGGDPRCGRARSEEHTSELQSRENLVCRLLLEKKKYKRYLIAHRELLLLST